MTQAVEKWSGPYANVNRVEGIKYRGLTRRYKVDRGFHIYYYEYY